MNTKNNIHVLSRAVIMDRASILLCKTIDFAHNFYFLPGGHVEQGESVEAALLRELVEETGAVCNIKRFLGCLEYSFDPLHNPICHNHEYSFIFEVASDALKVDSKIPKLEKHIELIWHPFNKLSEIDFKAEILQVLIPQWLNAAPSNAFKSVML